MPPKNNFYKITLILIVFITFFTLQQTSASKPFHPVPKEINDNTPKLVFEQNTAKKILILKSYQSDFSVQLFDIDGNTIENLTIKKNTQLEISTKDLKPGDYYLRYIGATTKNNRTKKITID